MRLFLVIDDAAAVTSDFASNVTTYLHSALVDDGFIDEKKCSREKPPVACAAVVGFALNHGSEMAEVMPLTSSRKETMFYLLCRFEYTVKRSVFDRNNNIWNENNSYLLLGFWIIWKRNTCLEYFD